MALAPPNQTQVEGSTLLCSQTRKKGEKYLIEELFSIF